MKNLSLALLLCAAVLAPAASADQPPPQPPPPLPRLPRLQQQAAPRLMPMAPAPVPATAPPAPRRVAARKPPPPPAGPAPDVKLVLEAPTLTGLWVLRVRNDGQVPVMLAADARLLSLEVTPRGERKPVRCELPADMRPSDDLDRSLVLPPGRSYAEYIQPRLYCFGERALDALAPGAIVVAHLGWPAGARGETRQVVWPIDGVEPAIAPQPMLTAPPIALLDEPTPMLAPVATPPLGSSEPVSLRITGNRTVDAPSLGGLSITVTLHNDGSRPVRVRFRPENLAFELTTSSGAEHCAWPLPPTAPMRELFTTLPPHDSTSLTVLLEAYCRRRSFDQPGLVVVRPALDTRKAGGEAIGLRTFDGQVIATAPTVVRLHQGTGKARLLQPRLELQATPPAATPSIDPPK